MIIDSHAHYNNNAYKKPFRYLTYSKDGYALKEGDWPQLLQELEDANIPCPSFRLWYFCSAAL